MIVGFTIVCAIYINKCCDLPIGVNVSLAQSKYSVAENSKTLMVDITMNVTASEDVEVDVIFSNGSAKGEVEKYKYCQYTIVFHTAGEDYTSLTSHVSISAGSTSSSFSIDITNDLIQEDNETFNIEIKLLPNCVSLLLGISSSTVTIIDNDGNYNHHLFFTYHSTVL